MTLCQTCGGTVLPPAISGAKRGSCHCNRPNTAEEEMAKTKKRAKAQEETTETPAEVTAEASEVATADMAKENTPRAPKAIAFNPEGEMKAAKQGSKLAALIDALVPGATMEQLVKVLSQSGSAVDASGVRSWLSYDLKKTGLGVHQVDNHFFLVGTPLPHRAATAMKIAPVAPLKVLSGDPKAKKSAMKPAKSKKASVK